MIYLAGSLKNYAVPAIAAELRKAGFEVFDDWWAAGRAVSKMWQEYCQARSMSYAETLKHPFAQQVFKRDREHIEKCDAVVAASIGKSVCWELGYANGLGKPTFVLLLEEPQERDLMLAGAMLVYTVSDLIEALKEVL